MNGFWTWFLQGSSPATRPQGPPTLYIYIYIYKVDRLMSRGILKAPLSITSTLSHTKECYFFSWTAPLTLDPYLIMLSGKQESIIFFKSLVWLTLKLNLSCTRRLAAWPSLLIIEQLRVSIPRAVFLTQAHCSTNTSLAHL